MFRGQFQISSEKFPNLWTNNSWSILNKFLYLDTRYPNTKGFVVFLFSSMWMSSCFNKFCRKDFISPLKCFDVFVKNQSVVCVSLFLCSLSCFLINLCSQYNTVFITTAFNVGLEIRWCESSFVFLQPCFGYSGCYEFPNRFWNQIISFYKNLLEF